MKSFLARTYDRLSHFMAGRYGVDKLCWALVLFTCLISFVRMFFKNILVYGILSALMLAVLGWAVFRALSRNTYRRYREGQKFEAVWNKVTAFFKLQKNRFRDRKTHVYRRCPSCHATLRFPKVRGRHASHCPRCGKAMNVKIR